MDAYTVQTGELDGYIRGKGLYSICTLYVHVQVYTMMFWVILVSCQVYIVRCIQCNVGQRGGSKILNVDACMIGDCSCA